MHHAGTWVVLIVAAAVAVMVFAPFLFKKRQKVDAFVAKEKQALKQSAANALEAAEKKENDVYNKVHEYLE